MHGDGDLRVHRQLVGLGYGRQHPHVLGERRQREGERVQPHRQHAARGRRRTSAPTAGGLGVTDGSEGNGGNDTHKVDNIGGRNNYVLFEFSKPVVDQPRVPRYVGADSDISVWIGTKTDPYNNHLTLSDAVLSSLAKEDNTTDSADARWADLQRRRASRATCSSSRRWSATPRPRTRSRSRRSRSAACPTVCTTGGTLSFTGNSASSGTAGNIRTFTTGSVDVKASAFSRTDSTGAWATAYLGAYGPGLGVTDGSEGTGANNTHKVDNIGGRNNYVLFEFSQPVVIDKAFLDAIGADSDITVWIGTKNDPFNNHLTLSDAVLSTLTKEENQTDRHGGAVGRHQQRATLRQRGHHLRPGRRHVSGGRVQDVEAGHHLQVIHGLRRQRCRVWAAPLRQTEVSTLLDFFRDGAW